MICNKCGKEFSPKVYNIHIQKCNIEKKVDIEEMNRKDLMELAKKKGIKKYTTMKTEDIKKELVK